MQPIQPGDGVNPQDRVINGKNVEISPDKLAELERHMISDTMFNQAKELHEQNKWLGPDGAHPYAHFDETLEAIPGQDMTPAQFNKILDQLTEAMTKVAMNHQFHRG